LVDARTTPIGYIVIVARAAITGIDVTGHALEHHAAAVLEVSEVIDGVLKDNDEVVIDRRAGAVRVVAMTAELLTAEIFTEISHGVPRMV